MNKHVSRAGVACAAAIAIAGCASNASLTPGSPNSPVNGALTNRAPAYQPVRSAVPLTSSGFLLNYYNGAVLLNPKMYVVFWGYKKAGDPDKVAQLLVSYAKAIGGSAHDNIYTQYYDIVQSQKNYITNPKNQFGGAWFDNSAVPPSPTDAQVAAEAVKAVSKFGYDPNGSYVVATPHGRSSQGFGTQWCSYHSATYDGGEIIPYTNLPYIPDAGKTCGAYAIEPPKDESAQDEGVTISEGADYGASVTDPNPGAGWYNLQYGEIGDCEGSIKNDKFGDKLYTTKPMDSNASESCVQEYN